MIVHGGQNHLGDSSYQMTTATNSYTTMIVRRCFTHLKDSSYKMVTATNWMHSNDSKQRIHSFDQHPSVLLFCLKDSSGQMAPNIQQ